MLSVIVGHGGVRWGLLPLAHWEEGGMGLLVACLDIQASRRVTLELRSIGQDQHEEQTSTGGECVALVFTATGCQASLSGNLSTTIGVPESRSIIHGKEDGEEC